MGPPLERYKSSMGMLLLLLTHNLKDQSNPQQPSTAGLTSLAVTVELGAVIFCAALADWLQRKYQNVLWNMKGPDLLNTFCH